MKRREVEKNSVSKRSKIVIFEGSDNFKNDLQVIVEATTVYSILEKLFNYTKDPARFLMYLSPFMSK